MNFDPTVFFAALGITVLEMVEASAVGLALYGESRRPAAFLYVALGVLVVFIPMFVVGAAFSNLPIVYVKLIGGVLLLYFGQRLVKSARRSVLNARRNKVSVDHFEKGVMSTGFSVGAIEARSSSSASSRSTTIRLWQAWAWRRSPWSSPPTRSRTR
jgi:uncharacterized membrane protein